MMSALVHGFGPAENGVVAGALERAGFAPRDGVGGLEALVTSLDRPALVVAAVGPGAAAGCLLRCAHLHEEHLFVAALAEGTERGLLSAGAYATGGRLLFLPVVEAEALRLFQDCRAPARGLEARRTVAWGMRRQEIVLDLGTDEVRVTELAWYLTDRLTDAGFCSGADRRRRTSLAIEEALVNAVEHGNLELDSGLRSSSAGVVDPYEALRLERLADPRYASRRVRISLAVEAGEASVVVSDEGRGFGPSEPPGGTASDETGRGLTLMRRAFDTVGHEGSTVVMRIEKERRDANGSPQVG